MIVQPVETIRQEPPDPLAHVLLGQVHEPGDLDQREPVSDPQDRPAPPGPGPGGWSYCGGVVPIGPVPPHSRLCATTSCGLSSVPPRLSSPSRARPVSYPKQRRGEFPSLFAVSGT